MHITSVGLRAWGTQGLRSRERRQVCCVRACVRAFRRERVCRRTLCPLPPYCREQCKRNVCVCVRVRHLVRGSTCAARVIGWAVWCVRACVLLS